MARTKQQARKKTLASAPTSTDAYNEILEMLHDQDPEPAGDVATLEEKLKQALSELQRHKNRAEAAETMVKTMNEAHQKALAQETRRAEAAVQDKVALREALQRRAKATEDELKEVQAMHCRLKAQHENAQDDLRYFEVESEIRNKHAADQTKELETTKKALKAKTTELTAMKKEAAAAREQVVSVRDEMKKVMESRKRKSTMTSVSPVCSAKKTKTESDDGLFVPAEEFDQTRGVSGLSDDSM